MAYVAYAFISNECDDCGRMWIIYRYIYITVNILMPLGVNIVCTCGMKAANCWREIDTHNFERIRKELLCRDEGQAFGETYIVLRSML